jgi:imidazole glycerol-phosphate synthase subunit HisH
MNVAMFDYGTGNLHSLSKAIQAAGHSVAVEADPDRLLAADALVLPGVGAFGAAAALLAPVADRIRAALEDGYPCLGVCLGMQLLFDGSDEGGGAGLGVLPGHVRRLRARRVPHMGWNRVDPIGPDPLFEGAGDSLVYYANSYVAEPHDDACVVAYTEYGGRRFVAAVRRERTWGVQFHPEKSDAAGLRIVRNFLGQAAH